MPRDIFIINEHQMSIFFQILQLIFAQYSSSIAFVQFLQFDYLYCFFAIARHPTLLCTSCENFLNCFIVYSLIQFWLVHIVFGAVVVFFSISFSLMVGVVFLLPLHIANGENHIALKLIQPSWNRILIEYMESYWNIVCKQEKVNIKSLLIKFSHTHTTTYIYTLALAYIHAVFSNSHLHFGLVSYAMFVCSFILASVLAFHYEN